MRSRDDDSGVRIEFTDLAPEPEVFLGQSAYLFLRYAESAARHAHDSTDLETESTLAVVAEEQARVAVLAAEGRVGHHHVDPLGGRVVAQRRLRQRAQEAHAIGHACTVAAGCGVRC